MKKFFKQGIALLLAVVIAAAFVLYRSSDRQLQAGSFPDGTETGLENEYPGADATVAAVQELALDEFRQGEEPGTGAEAPEDAAGPDRGAAEREEAEDASRVKTPSGEEDTASAQDAGEGGRPEETRGGDREEEGAPEVSAQGQDRAFYETDEDSAGQFDVQPSAGDASGGQFDVQPSAGDASGGQFDVQPSAGDASGGQSDVQPSAGDASGGRQTIFYTNEEDAEKESERESEKNTEKSTDRNTEKNTDGNTEKNSDGNIEKNPERNAVGKQIFFYMAEDGDGETQTDSAGAAVGQPAARDADKDAKKSAKEAANPAVNKDSDEAADSAETEAGAEVGASADASDDTGLGSPEAGDGQGPAEADDGQGSTGETGTDAAAGSETSGDVGTTAATAAEAATGVTAAEAVETAATGITELEPGEVTAPEPVADTLVFQGPDYKVTAAYGPEAGIPTGAVLVVSEIPEDSEEFRAYRAQVETTVAGDLEGNAGSADTSGASANKKDKTDKNHSDAAGASADQDGNEATGASADKNHSESAVASADRNNPGTAGESSAETSLSLSWLRLFDISIEVGGQPVEPTGPVAVQITYVEAIEQEETAEVGTVHFEGAGETPKVLEIQTEGTQTSTGQVSFETEGFSVFAIYAVTIEKVVLASDGHNYRVRVTYGPDAGIPAGASLEAAEILPGDEEYELHLARTAEAVGTGTGEILQLRLFDLRIVDEEGSQVEPRASVEVQVTLDDPVETSEAQALQIVHFAQEGAEILEADITGRQEGTADQFVFTTESFSVYSIVSYGETADLDGRTFALVSPLDGRTPWAGLLAQPHPSQAGRLKASACYEYDQPYPYLSSEDDLTMWTFAKASGGRYTIQADNGQYLRISKDAISLSDEPQALAVDTDASHAGRVHITDGDRHSLNLYNWKVADGFGQWYDNGQNEWFRLYDLDSIDLSQKASGRKVSVQDIQDAQEVLLYRRVWNETSQEFDNYAIDGNGNLVYLFDNGEILNYRSKTSLLWKVIMHRDPATFELNGYYDFCNVETGKYLAPTGDGILSDQPLGVTLNGRRLGDYDSAIEGWDSGAFAWYGYRVKDRQLETATGAGSAEAFCFALPTQIQPGALETVQTIDSTRDGIRIQMYNFGSRSQMSNLIGNDAYTNGNTNSVVRNTLGESGFPVSSINGNDLSGLFSSANYVGEANHLFLKSVYDETGYYEYSCFNNFAVYDRESGDFTLYKDLGTPSNDNRFYYKRGNFFPYNTLDTTREASNRNDYYGDGAPALEMDPSQGRALYLFQENPDYYFGMTLEAGFLQARGGLDEKGEPISYAFNGDDDLWVFIDGVLILDIGGIHDAIPGSINFATGDIFVNGKKVSTIRDQFEKAGKPTDDFAGNTFADYSGHAMKMFYMERGAGASNLEIHFNLPVIEQGTFAVEKQLTGTNQQAYANVQFAFQALLVDPDHPDDRTRDIPLRGSAASGNAGTTAGTAGGAGSGGAAAGKNAGTGGGNNADAAAGQNTGAAGGNGAGSEGTAAADPGAASPPRQVRVLYEGTESEVPFYDHVQIGEGVYDNVFYLQPGQAAVFYDIPDDVRYYVREIDVSGDYYETVLINDAGLGEDAGLTEGSAVTATSTARTILQRQRVLFENQCSAKNVRSLRITKHVENPNPAGDPTFEFRVTLEGPDGRMVPYIMGEYYLLDPDGNYCHYVNGRLTSNGTGEENKVVCSVSGNNGSISGVPDGYTVVIEGVLAGTDFHVEEIRIPDGFEMTGKTVENCDPPTTAGAAQNPAAAVADAGQTGSGTADGSIALGKDAQVTITNRHYSYLKVTKVWDTGTCPVDKHGDLYVALYRLSEGERETYVQGSLRTIAWPATSVFWSLDLADGDSLAGYVVREVCLQDGVTPDAKTAQAEDLHPITRTGTALPVTGERMEGSAVADTDHTYIFANYIRGEERTEASGEDLNIQMREDTLVNRLPRLMVTKTDPDGRPLEGAAFRLLRPVAAGDGAAEETDRSAGTDSAVGENAGNVGTNSATGENTQNDGSDRTKETAGADQENPGPGDDVAETPEKTTADIPAGLEPVPGCEDLRSDEAGRVLTKACLADGTYYLQETAAPEGCQLLTDLIRIEVGGSANLVYRAYLDPAAGTSGTGGTGTDGGRYFRDQTRDDDLTYTFTVINNRNGYELPSTGGPGRGSRPLALAAILLALALLRAADRLLA